MFEHLALYKIEYKINFELIKKIEVTKALHAIHKEGRLRSLQKDMLCKLV